uniref:Tudor domain-containing protein n=1 Tax=Tanacetum cinerariifolium TaxID=118510 RepID=A0A6L2L623_TANCI|nr:hypothetical protein [Tanacetum cinerariifolium]
MMEEENGLADLKAASVKSKKALKKLTPTQRMAQERELGDLEAKRKQQMDRTKIEYLNCIEKKADNLPIIKFKFHIEKASKMAHMTIARNNQPVNFQVYADFKLKMLDFTIAPPHQLIDTELPPIEKMRKRIKELIQHVFLNKEVIVDGMERNLVPPQSVTTRKLGEVIKHLKPEILFYNGNVELVMKKITKRGHFGVKTKKFDSADKEGYGVSHFHAYAVLSYSTPRMKPVSKTTDLPISLLRLMVDQTLGHPNLLTTLSIRTSFTTQAWEAGLTCESVLPKDVESYNIKILQDEMIKERIEVV